MNLSDLKKQWIGTWENRKKSRLKISDVLAMTTGSSDQTEHYRVTGLYQTAKGSVPYDAQFPVSGFVLSDQIVFSVSFRFTGDGKPVSSATAWAGQILPSDSDPSSEVLKSLWNLVPNLEDGDEEEDLGWALVWSGADEFTKLSDDPNF